MQYNEQFKAWTVDTVVNGYFKCYIATQTKKGTWKVTTKNQAGTRVTVFTGTEEECKQFMSKFVR